jgi:hypothetical protein
VDQCEKENGFGHDAIVDDKIVKGMKPAGLQMQFNDSERNVA